MTYEEIETIYGIIKEFHEKYLAMHGVKLPAIKESGKYTKNALVLIYLAKDYPDTHIVSKDKLTSFVRQFYPDTNDVQQARHLAMQSGWNILSGTRGDSKEIIPSGSYKLVSLEKPYPAFAQDRRVGFDTDDFDEIKKQYGYRCTTCGSKEGEEHFFRKGVIIKLQKGHMDSTKPLATGNIIPQCQICNRGDRNRWIYDKTGRAIEIAQTDDGIRIVKTFLKKASRGIQENIFEFLEKLLGKK